jgi:hypothetical protein
MTSTIRDASAKDYRNHGSAGSSPGTNGLKITTGTAVTSWTDLYGTSVTSRTSAYDEQYDAWRIQASSNHINIGSTTATDWGVDGTTVTKRYKPRLLISSWTDSGTNPTVTLNSVTKTKGTDYEVYNDTGAQVLYLAWLSDLAGTEGALDVSAGGATDLYPAYMQEIIVTWLPIYRM